MINTTTVKEALKEKDLQELIGSSLVPTYHRQHSQAQLRAQPVMMRTVSLAVLIILVSVLQFGDVVDGALSTIVESGEEECFAFRAPAGENVIISGDFDCIDDELSPDPIGVILYDPKMTPVWKSVSGSSEGSFSVNGSFGKYELCIQNGNLGSDDYYGTKDGNAREVGFAVRVTTPLRGLEDEKSGPDDSLTSHMLDMCTKMLAGLQTMADHQEYMRERENHHTGLAEETFHRVVQWTVLEAIVLILIASGQVIYLRRFFEKTRYL